MGLGALHTYGATLSSGNVRLNLSKEPARAQPQSEEGQFTKCKPRFGAPNGAGMRICLKQVPGNRE